MSERIVTAQSADGVWRFDGSRLRSAHAVVEPPEIDCFERWTFARFCPRGHLILAFESSQPWSEYGSHGSPYGGVQVLVPTADPALWELRAIEFDCRRHDADFVPDDVVWHPRGVLAWLHDRTLYVQVLRAPRVGRVEFDVLNPRDSDNGLAYYHDWPGTWRSLELDDDGLVLSARDAAGVDRFDLARRLQARDDGEWSDFAEF